MQRLTSAATIDDSTLAIYEETVTIIHRHLPPSLALLYATARRNTEGRLEWWTERQGLARPVLALTDEEQMAVQAKRQQYQSILASLIEQLSARGEDKSAQALSTLLNHSGQLFCYDVGGEPVLINWAIPSESSLPVQVATPRKKFFILLPLLLLLTLLLALAWWYLHRTPAAVPLSPQTHRELTEDNPSISLSKRKDFGQIKINLTWQQGEQQKPVDLDIAAFIRFKNGDKSGVEALSKFLGYYEKPPYMLLKQDLREGDDRDGEWLFINGSHWQDIDEVLIYSFMYDGTNNWQGTEATITLYVPGQPPITSTLVDSNERNNVAAIARLKNVDGDIKVERLNHFFLSRESLDKHYGWGFEWTPGATKN
jgi:tellurite resistance protein TerA